MLDDCVNVPVRQKQVSKNLSKTHLESRVYLDLHVKVKSESRDDDRLLDETGMDRG